MRRVAINPRNRGCAGAASRPRRVTAATRRRRRGRQRCLRWVRRACDHGRRSRTVEAAPGSRARSGESLPPARGCESRGFSRHGRRRTTVADATSDCGCRREDRGRATRHPRRVRRASSPRASSRAGRPRRRAALGIARRLTGVHRHAERLEDGRRARRATRASSAAAKTGSLRAEGRKGRMRTHHVAR